MKPTALFEQLAFLRQQLCITSSSRISRGVDILKFYFTFQKNTLPVSREDGNTWFLRNVGKFVSGYSESDPRRRQSSVFLYVFLETSVRFNMDLLIRAEKMSSPGLRLPVQCERNNGMVPTFVMKYTATAFLHALLHLQG